LQQLVIFLFTTCSARAERNNSTEVTVEAYVNWLLIVIFSLASTRPPINHLVTEEEKEGCDGKNSQKRKTVS